MQPITIIGGGNVGYHFGRAFRQKGIPIVQAFRRKPDEAAAFAEAIGARPCHDLQRLEAHNGLYLLAVKDDAIAAVARELYRTGKIMPDTLIAHTSGATPSTVLAPYAERYGVFYPLQTMSRHRPVELTEVPLCITASDEQGEADLLSLARHLSPNARPISDEQRAALHLAAVFVNNFTNAVLQGAHDIADEQSAPFEMLIPLLRETVRKASDGMPKAVQTGPAIRGDEATLSRHRAQLSNHPQLLTVYDALSNYIKTF